MFPITKPAPKLDASEEPIISTDGFDIMFSIGIVLINLEKVFSFLLNFILDSNCPVSIAKRNYPGPPNENTKGRKTGIIKLPIASIKNFQTWEVLN